MLVRGFWHLHAPRLANGRMRYITIAANFIACIDNHNPFLFGENTRHFAQHGRLSNARAAQEQDTVPLLHNIIDDVNSTVDSPSDATG
jgi:hypothetical protein